MTPAKPPTRAQERVLRAAAKVLQDLARTSGGDHRAEITVGATSIAFEVTTYCVSGCKEYPHTTFYRTLEETDHAD